MYDAKLNIWLGLGINRTWLQFSTDLFIKRPMCKIWPDFLFKNWSAEIMLKISMYYQIKSNQINFIYIAQNHSHFASVGFTICTVKNILCP